MVKDTDIRTTMIMPRTLMAKLVRQAKREDLTVSQLVRKYCREGLERA